MKHQKAKKFLFSHREKFFCFLREARTNVYASDDVGKFLMEGSLGLGLGVALLFGGCLLLWSGSFFRHRFFYVGICWRCYTKNVAVICLLLLCGAMWRGTGEVLY